MSKPMPTVSMFMSTSPHSIGKSQSIARAKQVMHDFGIRHLPVLEGGHLVGVVSDRDVALLEALREVDVEHVAIEDAMSQLVYTISPEAHLDEVAAEMAEKRYGSAVVVEGGKVVGILTTTDLARALAELLRTRLA